METGKRVNNTEPRTACQTCLQRQFRCDEKRPVCSNCIDNGRVCEYVPSPDTKGSQLPQAYHGVPHSRSSSGSQVHTLPPTNHALTGDTTLTSASIPPSLDPYPESLLPLTPARRALLAFCKRSIMPFLINSGPIGSRRLIGSL